MIKPERKEAISELAQILEIPCHLILQALGMLENKSGYRVWSIPKKSGGKRQIQAALWPLREIQARIAALIYPYSISEINHGFIPGRSHQTAVLPHLLANAMFCWDIKDAFSSTTKKQVLLKFRVIGFNNPLADLMADLVCYSATGKSEDGFLPQGYCSSPIIFNLVLKDIDRLLFLFAQQRDYQISRYVDNFAISTPKKEIPRQDRELVVRIVMNLSNGSYKVPEEKTSYFKVEEDKVCFEFLGLVIKGPKKGKREIRVTDEKLADYRWTIHDALEKGDFSDRKVREIRGKINYLKSVYQRQSLPLPIRIMELYFQYQQMAEVAKTGQLPLNLSGP